MQWVFKQVGRYGDWWGDRFYEARTAGGEFAEFAAICATIIAHIIAALLIIALVVVTFFPDRGDGSFYEGPNKCHYETIMVGKVIYRQKHCEAMPELAPIYDVPQTPTASPVAVN